MTENWDVAPWAFATIGGPVLLGAVIVYALLRRRTTRGRAPDSTPDNRSPDYSDPRQNR